MGGGRWRGWRHGALRWGPLAVLAIAWEASARFGLVDAQLFPPLSQVIARGWVLLRNGRLLADLAASAWRVLVGLAGAALLAFPLGIALGLYPALDRLCSGLLSLLRPLSPPAWIPLAILWFGIGDAPALFIIFVGTFFSLLVNVRAATKTLDPELIKAALTLGASRGQAVLHTILPALLPTLITQTRLGLGLAWMCVIAAEMVAVRHGLGFFMSEARNLFRTEDVLVGMFTIGLTGLATDRLLHGLEQRLCGWRRALDPAYVYTPRERAR